LLSGKGNQQDIYNIAIQNNRLNNLLKETQKIYNYYYGKVSASIQDTSELAMLNSYYRQQYVISWFTPIVVNNVFTILDPRIVEVAVTGSTELWSQIAKDVAKKIKQGLSIGINLIDIVPEYGTLSNLLYRNRIDDLTKIQQTIVQGFIQGKSINQMSTGIRDLMGNLKYQADRIALTESARTASEGSLLASQDASAQGINLKRQWHATRGGNTRDAHISVDGQRVEIDEPFRYGNLTTMTIGKWGKPAMDINCRCTIIDIINDENPELMRSRKDPLNPKSKNEVMTFKSYKEWAESKGLKFDENGILIR